MDSFGRAFRDFMRLIIAIIVIIFIIASFVIYSNFNKINNIEENNIIKTDSINILKDSINNLNNHIDTIELDNQLMKDTIFCFKQNYNLVEEENVVNRYKLERIRYYTDIAKRGNNIKFLRGWIYRVLNK